MSFYETLYIVDPNLENKVLEKTIDEIGKELEKTKAKIINHRLWGKKKLAYQIDRQKYGSYIIIQFEGGDQGKMYDYDTWMRLNKTVLRHMTVLLDEKPEVYVEEKEPQNEETSIDTNQDNEKNSKLGSESSDKNGSSNSENKEEKSGSDLEEGSKEVKD
tara:strand:+ start:541 stop:1020 length:480 start_codon:yes stop_codon:yes gene_type:complete